MSDMFRVCLVTCCVGWEALGMGCAKDSKEQQTAAVQPTAVIPPGGSTDLKAESEPVLVEDCYGLESGPVGIKECDEWVDKATACGRSHGKDEAFLAVSRQKRLVWKLAVRQAGDDPIKLQATQTGCREALAGLATLLKEQGCTEPTK